MPAEASEPAAAPDRSEAAVPPAEPLRPSLRDPWLKVVVLGALVFYTLQLAATALGGDNTEFIMLEQRTV